MPRQTAKIVQIPKAPADCDRLLPDSEEHLKSVIAKLERENMQLRRLIRFTALAMKGQVPKAFARHSISAVRRRGHGNRGGSARRGR